MKKCITCLVEKEESEFHTYEYLKSNKCKDCKRAYQKAHRKQNPEIYKLRDEKKKHKRKYGLSDDQNVYAIKNRVGNCPICGKFQTMLCIDHDHTSMKFRGMICGDCNKGLGHLRDDIYIHASAIIYLVNSIYLNYEPASEDICLRCENIVKKEDRYHGKSICTPCVKYIRKSRDKSVLSAKLAMYNITLKQYQHFIEISNGKCQICANSEKDLKIDHCHKTGTVRGLLYHSCNAGIGFFYDDIEILQNAIEYLKNDGVLSWENNNGENKAA